MNILKKLFNKKEENQFDMCKRVIKNRGFKQNKKFGTYHKDFGGFDCLIWILDDSVKLKVYSKSQPYAETEYCGPPFPLENELIDFIKSNT
jgi:hypothetical protein